MPIPQLSTCEKCGASILVYLGGVTLHRCDVQESLGRPTIADLLSMIGPTVPWTPIEDPEDQIILILECEKCPRCGTKMELREVAGTRRFLYDTGYWEEALWQAKGNAPSAEHPYAVIEWPNDMPDHDGCQSYHCTTCNKGAEAYHSRYGDWTAGV